MESFVVIGSGRFGSSVARTIYGLGREVMVVDKDEDRIREISPHVSYAIQADILEDGVVEELGLSNFDAAIIAIGTEIEASVMATLVAKEKGIGFVLAKAQSPVHGRLLEKIGADRVVYPEKAMGQRVGHGLASSLALDFVELTPRHSLLEITVIKSWEGKKIENLDIEGRYKLSIVALRRGDDLKIIPSSKETLNKNDSLIIIGETQEIKRLEDKNLD